MIEPIPGTQTDMFPGHLTLTDSLDNVITLANFRLTPHTTRVPIAPLHSCPRSQPGGGSRRCRPRNARNRASSLPWSLRRVSPAQRAPRSGASKEGCSGAREP